MSEIKLDVVALREKWRALPNYGCWWSSPDNQKGLQLTPNIEPGRLWVEMQVESHHSGFPGIAHGGLAFTILDGLMGWYIMAHEGRAGFTTNCTVSYKGPLKVGETYTFEAKRDEGAKDESQVNLIGIAFQDPGAPLVQVTASFLLPNRELAKKVLRIDLGPEGEELFPV